MEHILSGTEFFFMSGSDDYKKKRKNEKNVTLKIVITGYYIISIDFSFIAFQQYVINKILLVDSVYRQLR